MEYFILSQKQNIPNSIELNLKTDNDYERRQIVEKQYADSVNDVSIVYTKDKKLSFYADVIDIPTFLISEKVKEVFINYDDSIIIKCVILDKTKIEGKKIFRVANLKEYSVIINLDVAESLLRRFLSGIDITRVEIIEKKEV